MSNDYYLNKWKNTIFRLENVVYQDSELQRTKQNDKTLCCAAQRWSAVLGNYIAIYNDMLDCRQQNLQVQKRKYMNDIIHALVARILELKQQLTKLTASNYHYLSHGLIQQKLTSQDAEFVDIPEKIERPEEVQAAIDGILAKAEEEKARLENQVTEEEKPDKAWWDIEEDEPENNLLDKICETKEKHLSEDTLKTRELVNLIGAHERSRQIIRKLTHEKQKREMWEKMLMGTMKPPAPQVLREQAAKFIQKTLRTYFELKRKKITDCTRDQIIGFRRCAKQSDYERRKAEELNVIRAEKYETFEKEWKQQRDNIKNISLRKADDIADDFREYIRDWFRQWYDAVKFFYDIPTPDRGGSALIFKQEVPTPEEWMEISEMYMEKKNTDKNQSAIMKKEAKMQAKQDALILRREHKLKAKMEAELKKKLMKNPKLHPGYTYPDSKKTQDISNILKKYHQEWDLLDADNTIYVKQGHIIEIDEQEIWSQLKVDIINKVDEDMKLELKQLRKALKKYYDRIGEKMPEMMKNRKLKVKKQPDVMKYTISASVAEKMEKLALQGFLKKYPRTKLEDFRGDPNFAADDFPCYFKPGIPFNGDTKSLWWEHCRELVGGCHYVLLVGPAASGKTTLVHAMASLNDATLFELDPGKFPEELLSPAYLQQLMESIASSAKAAQPSLVYIKHVHRLFYNKVPQGEPDISPNLWLQYIKKQLFKNIKKTDKITVVGSCMDPWLTKSKKLLKQFPNVILIPNTSYTTTVQILMDWVTNNRMVPPDLDVHSLAFSLKGYTYGFLKESLQNFLSADRIAKIAFKGLQPEEIFEYILDNEKQTKPDYEKYTKWFREKTIEGKREKKHYQEQKEFKEILEKYAEREKKKTKASSAANSTSSSLQGA